LIGYSWKFLGRLGDQRDGLGIEERDLQEREKKQSKLRKNKVSN
jgi:hypothetical protein